MMPFPVPVLLPRVTGDLAARLDSLFYGAGVLLALLLLASAGAWLFFPQGDEQP